MKTFYYETHITIEPLFEQDLERVKLICEGSGFKVANLLMQKRKEDTPTQSRFDTFMTAHNQDLNKAIVQLIDFMKLLKSVGVKVHRYKIEDVIIDSRNLDVFCLLE